MAPKFGLGLRAGGHIESGLQLARYRIGGDGPGLLTGSVKDTGLDFAAGDVVMGVFVQIHTAEATATTKTIDVGILASESGGDEDGFLDGAVTSATGVVTVAATATDGTNQNFWAAAPILGALLRNGLLGGDVAGTAGVMIPVPWVCDGTAKSLTYTLGSDHTELVADIFVLFFRAPAINK
jgi:hypothetical protein